MFDNNEKQQVNYQPNDDEAEVLKGINQKFEDSRSQRELPYRFFENRSFEQFIQSNKDNFNSYTKPRNSLSSLIRIILTVIRNHVIRTGRLEYLSR